MLSIAPKGPIAGGRDGQAASAGAPSGQAENRSAPRHLAAAVPGITGLRISPHGVEAKLVNISESGVLAECGERLKPGSSVTVVFEGTFTPRTMEGRVARNSVSSMGSDGRLRYHVGIAFAKRVSLPVEAEPVAEVPPEPAPAPAAVVEVAAAVPAAAPAAASQPSPVPAVAAVVPIAATPIAAAPAPPPPPAQGAATAVVQQPIRNRW